MADAPPGMATEAVAKMIWDSYIAAVRRHPRGIIMNMPDDKARVRCLIGAVAEVIAPMVLELEQLRREAQP